MKPVFTTERFDVFHVECERNPVLGVPRDVYLAFYRDEDVPRPVCTITIWPTYPGGGVDDCGRIAYPQNFIEWCEVPEDSRRDGIATEVLLGLQAFIGPLLGDGVTESGEAFAEALGDRLLGNRPHPFNQQFVEKLLGEGRTMKEIDEAAAEWFENFYKELNAKWPRKGA